MSRRRLGLVLVLTLSAIYLYTFPAATIIYGGGVLLHTGAGILLAVLLTPILRTVFRESGLAEKLAWMLLAAGTVLGLVLIKIGTPNRFKTWLYLHIALCAIGVLLLLTSWVARRNWLGKGIAGAGTSFAAVALLLTAIGAGSWWVRAVAWKNAYRVENPKMPAATMDGEGDGPKRRFFPSSAQTTRRRQNPEQIFHGVGGLRALPRGHLQPVVQLGAPLLVVQQPVVPQKHRVHAGRRSGPSPRNGAAAATIPAVLFSGLMDTPIKADRDTPGSAGRSGLHDVPLHRRR